MEKLAFCVTGWHYGDRETYRKLSLIEGATLFVVSHKKVQHIPEWVYDFVKRENVLVYPNFGYDWGCYQQFIQLGKWQDFDYIFFMHDDIEIKNIDFVKPCLELLQQYPVVGNGRVGEEIDWPDRTPQAYAHSQWKPPDRNFKHNVVRGSFFVTTRESLEAIGNFEVFWDSFHLTVGFGNWSLRATCGKWQSILGDRDCFGFLSETYCESPWISEFYRGGVKQENSSYPQSLKQKLTLWIIDICKINVEMYWEKERVLYHSILLILTDLIVSILSRNWQKFNSSPLRCF